MDERREGFADLDTRLRGVEQELVLLVKVVDRNERILIGDGDVDENHSGIRGRVIQATNSISRLDLKFAIMLWLIGIYITLTAPVKIAEFLNFLKHLSF